jgi:hypothetical protein
MLNVIYTFPEIFPPFGRCAMGTFYMALVVGTNKDNLMFSSKYLRKSFPTM